MKLLRNFAPVLAVLGSTLPMVSNAAAVDVTAVTTDIAAQAAPVAAIGAAILLIFVGIKAFKWVRRAMS
jgi:hypothetical protein